VGITLDGGIVYNHARFGPEAVAGLSLLSDNRPSFAPRWSANMNAQWDGQWKGIRLTGLMTLRHLGPHNTGSDLAPIKVQRGFALYNGSFELSKGSWGVSLWGQNLSNEVAQQVVFSAPFQTGSFHGFSYAPRTLGIRLRYR
jgi:outer membrane receptor protein involved in Fe transport